MPSERQSSDRVLVVSWHLVVALHSLLATEVSADREPFYSGKSNVFIREMLDQVNEHILTLRFGVTNDGQAKIETKQTYDNRTATLTTLRMSERH